MHERPPPFSRRRFRYGWTLWKVFRAEAKGQFDRALRLLEEAAAIMPLRMSDRVHQANLLLMSQRTREARTAFVALRNELKESDNPNRRYLRHYCTHQLSVLTPGSGQRSYEAKQGKIIEDRKSTRLNSSH